MIQGSRVEADNDFADVRGWLRDSIDDQFLDAAKDGSFHAAKLKATFRPTRALGTYFSRRKFDRMARPFSVRMLSGWNCTPQMGSEVCLTPITSPSSVQAVT